MELERSEYSARDPTKVYTNEIVVHNGKLWQARWWTQGQEPGTTGEWGPWVYIGDVDDRTEPGEPRDPEEPTDPDDPEQPVVLQDIKVVEVTDRKVVLDWEDIDLNGFTGFNVYRSHTADIIVSPVW